MEVRADQHVRFAVRPELGFPDDAASSVLDALDRTAVVGVEKTRPSRGSLVVLAYSSASMGTSATASG